MPIHSHAHLYDEARANQIADSEIDGLFTRVGFVDDMARNARAWMSLTRIQSDDLASLNALELDVGLALALGRDEGMYSWWLALSSWADGSSLGRQDLLRTISTCAASSPLLGTCTWEKLLTWLDQTIGEIQATCERLRAATKIAALVEEIAALNALLAILLASLTSRRLMSDIPEA